MPGGIESALSPDELRAIALEAHYFSQTSNGWIYQTDTGLSEKRERLLAEVGRHGFQLVEEFLSTEGPVPYAHLLFHRPSINAGRVFDAGSTSRICR